MMADFGKALLPMKAEPLRDREIADWIAGKRARRLLAIPFYGDLPSADGKGRDLDGEYFDARTDIKPDWFTERPLDWHHSKDPTGLMNGVLLGKATNLAMESDGWWVDTWMQAGERRLKLVGLLVGLSKPRQARQGRAHRRVAVLRADAQHVTAEQPFNLRQRQGGAGPLPPLGDPA